jgi:hypothetical protein
MLYISFLNMNFNNCYQCTHYGGAVIKHSKYCPKYGELKCDDSKFDNNTMLLVQNACHDECTWKHNLAIQIMFVIICVLLFKLWF